MKKYLITLFCACLPFSLVAGSPFCCKGRVDVGPVYLHLNAIENGKTADSFDMVGVRSDSTLLFFEGSGLCFKPTITYADKDAKFFAYAYAGYIRSLFRMMDNLHSPANLLSTLSEAVRRAHRPTSQPSKHR